MDIPDGLSNSVEAVSADEALDCPEVTQCVVRAIGAHNKILTSIEYMGLPGLVLSQKRYIGASFSLSGARVVGSAVADAAGRTVPPPGAGSVRLSPAAHANMGDLTGGVRLARKLKVAWSIQARWSHPDMPEVTVETACEVWRLEEQWGAEVLCQASPSYKAGPISDRLVTEEGDDTTHLTLI